MKSSKYLTSTLKENPSSADIISHKLMLRAGLIRQLSLGLYTWLPTGTRVLNKIKNIVREEMNKADALEIIMPFVQPASLWEESGRWKNYGPELLRFKDRYERDYVLGPTHEEVITSIVKNEIDSYKKLPINLFQIQTKFRDEIRPRFGVMRSREFIMKDSYSFHLDQETLDGTYNKMYKAYSNILNRLELDFRAVEADTGSIGGSASHEFQVLADSGEDTVVFSTGSDYAANIELAEAITKDVLVDGIEEKRLVETLNLKTINDLIKAFDVNIKKTLKTLIVKGEKSLVALVLRGDHTLNEIKAEKIEGILSPLEMADEKEIKEVIGASIGSLGVIDLNIPVVVDRSAAVVSDFVCGANKDNYHFFGVNWKRDVLANYIVADIRNVEVGDPSPKDSGTLVIKKGIEVGHIFKLGTKYSKAFNLNLLNEKGVKEDIIMGCYGIGITRLVAAIIEQSHDDKGIIWPKEVAPFKLAILPINMQKSERVKEKALELYNKAQDLGIEVILDDRKASFGVMLKDMELIGVSNILIIGDKKLDESLVEIKSRFKNESSFISIDATNDYLKGLKD
ncbi:MAG: proline--tRNA ligase [Psittacicella sp.]